MKYFIFFLIATSSFADDCSTTSSEEVVTGQTEIRTDVPNHLKGAKITVTLADGKSTTVPAEQFKVVPRRQQFIVAKTQKNIQTVCKNVDRNRVSVLGGYGAKPGLDSSASPTVVEVESRRGAVFGAQYQRKLGDTLSVGGQVQTNKTGSVLLGVDF